MQSQARSFFHDYVHLSFIFIFLSVIFFSGCHQTKPILTFAVGGAPSELAFWESILQDFQRQTQIEVHMLRQPPDTDQRRQNFLVALESKQSNPDVFLMDVAWTAQFARSQWLEPLDSKISQDAFPKHLLFEKVIQLVGTFENQIFALPVYIDGGLLYYRKDLLEKFGWNTPPKTWEELVIMAQTVQTAMRSQDPRFYGLVWQGAQNEGMVCNFMEFMTAFGGGIQIQNRPHIENAANQTALIFMQNLIHQNKLSPPNTFTEMKEEDSRILFEQGHALFERNWPYAWVLHQKENSPVKNLVGIAPLPGTANGPSASTLGGWHVGISRFSDQKENAWKLAQFLLSEKIQKRLALEVGWNPGRRDIYEDPEVLAKLPHFQSLRTVFENTAPRPPVPYWTQLSDVLQKNVNAALAQNISAAESLQRSEQDFQRIIQRYEGRRS